MKVYQFKPKYDWVEAILEFSDFLETRMMTKELFKKSFGEREIIKYQDDDEKNITTIKLKMRCRKEDWKI
jgi:hypothetical protein|nr:MAG TPA: hypothetical protein [Caudoviricetes sp.]